MQGKIAAPTVTRRCCLMTSAASLGLGFARAAQSQTAANPATPRIVATFSLLADIARQLAPKAATVESLVGPDADTHVFEPSPADARRLAQAEVIVVNGLGFEGWIDRLIKVSGSKAAVAVASAGIVPLKRVASDQAHRGRAQEDTIGDPHAWQDLRLGRQYAINVSLALAQRWPQHQTEVLTRTKDYLQRVDQLDQQMRDGFNAIPREQRRVITSHDAFAYLGAAYGIDFLAAQGWNTQGEPSAAGMARLIKQIRREGVRALFVENISDPRLVERIAKEAGAKLGGTLYSDALSKPGGPASTYLDMMAHNAKTLMLAMTASATTKAP